MKILLVLILLGFAAIIYRVIKGEQTAYILSRRFGPVLCRLIGHRRRGDAVRKIEGVYHSRCRRCGVKLVKANRDSEWHTEDDAFEDDDVTDRGGKSESVREGGSSLTAVLMIVGGVAVGALAIGFMMAPHHMQMRELPNRSFAELAHG